ncbi:MAG: hypothetical protein LC111_11070, partial [Bacteroidia bacterium]|nr:hypothetical protein [Bacteroidia bacterium]
ASTFVVKIATFAKPETVIGNSMTTVQTLTDISKMNETTSLAKPFGYTSQRQKRSNATHQPTQVASHLPLPQRTKTILPTTTQFGV